MDQFTHAGIGLRSQVQCLPIVAPRPDGTTSHPPTTSGPSSMIELIQSEYWRTSAYTPGRFQMVKFSIFLFECYLNTREVQYIFDPLLVSGTSDSP